MDTSGQEPCDASVDPREAAKFRRLAKSWWDKSGPFWPLHKLNAVRVPWILDHLCRQLGLDRNLDHPLRGLSVLDIGCGGGILAESMADLGAAVHGIDVVEENLNIARSHADENGLDITYSLSTVEELARGGNRYDVVLNMEVVEHVADLGSFLEASCRLLMPRGNMFLATINKTPQAWITAVLGAEYVLRWLPRGTHRWALLRPPEELKALLEKGGLSVRDMVGVKVNPMSRQMSLTRSTKVNYMLTAARDYNLAGGGTG